MQSPTHGPFRAGFRISTKNLRNTHVGSFPDLESLPKTPENFPALRQAAAVIAEPGAAGQPAELAPSGAFLGTTHPASRPGKVTPQAGPLRAALLWLLHMCSRWQAESEGPWPPWVLLGQTSLQKTGTKQGLVPATSQTGSKPRP